MDKMMARMLNVVVLYKHTYVHVYVRIIHNQSVKQLAAQQERMGRGPHKEYMHRTRFSIHFT